MADPKTDKQAEAEAHVDTLVRRGLKALEQFRELNQEQVDYIVAKASVAALDQHGKTRRRKTSLPANTSSTTCATPKPLASSAKTR